VSRERSPKREKAFKLWCESGRARKLSSIAKELGLKPEMVRKWKYIDSWDERLDPKRRRKGAPDGNKNAVGNKGGPGGPARNQKALKTGEFATIWLDALEDDEREILFDVETDPITQIENAIRLLELRERRMLQLRAKIISGWDDTDVVSTSQLVEEDEAEFNIIDHEGNVSTMSVKQPRFKEVHKVVKSSNQLDKVLAIEEALTRIQDKKGKFIDLLNKIEMRALSDEEQKVRILKLKEELKVISAKAW